MHERRKYLHEGVLWKWAGLGFYGTARLERSKRIYEGGFGPEPLGLENGFLLTRWVVGKPARTLPPVFESYLTFLDSAFRTGQANDTEALRNMIRTNTGLDLQPEEAETVALDGRMLPQEWIETKDGFVKTDALDHHDDHFFPGCQPIAWDRAGVMVEFGLVDRAEDFWTKAYLAWRIGYTAMAAENLRDSPDGLRFGRQRDRYLQMLGKADGTAASVRPHRNSN
jgi:hypothetical protein